MKNKKRKPPKKNIVKPGLYKELKKHLSHVDIYKLQEKISNFRKLSFKTLSRQELAAEISNVLCFSTPRGPVSVLAPMSSQYPSGTKFFRVRALDKDDLNIPLRGMRTEQDAWNPPSKFVRQGRLNQEGESFLYVTPVTPNVAIEELKICDGDVFSLIVYEAIDNINVTCIGFPPNIPELTKEEDFKLKMLSEFLANEFTRDVGIGTEFLYKISEIIAKDYFDLPPPIHDAWCYPSIAERAAVNVCFRPSVARQKLKLVGACISTCQRGEGQMRINVQKIASGFDTEGIFQYHSIGSEEQLRIFPEIGNNTNSAHS